MKSAFTEALLHAEVGPAVMRAVPILFIILNDEKMLIGLASPLLEKMFGYEDGELLGKSLDVLIPERSIENHHKHVERLRVSYEASEKLPIDRTMNDGVWVSGVKKDGTDIKVQVGLTSHLIGGEVYVMAYVCDVTNAFNHIPPEIPIVQPCS